jgi:hypothetical protein
MLFEMLQASIEDLFHTEHHAAKDVLCVIDTAMYIVDAAIHIGEAHVNRFSEVSEAGIIDQYPDERGNCGESGGGGR